MDNSSKQVIKRNVATCLYTLKEYKWLLDSYILDFFTEDHTLKLPTTWVQFFDDLPLDTLGRWIIDNSFQFKGAVAPLSLQCLRAISQNMLLYRTTDPLNKHLSSLDLCGPKDEKNWNNMMVQYEEKSQPKNEIIDLKSALFKHPRLKNIFCKHVKPKKRYEILKLAEVTVVAAHRTGVQFIVDVGSGLGHLSRTLAYGYNLKVAGLEIQRELITQARILDLELETTTSKHLSEDEMESVRAYRPVHFEERISFDFDERRLKEIVEFQFGDVPYGIVGLHPCGDLAAILLKVFLKSPNAKFINVVGCCYHKLSVINEDKEILGYPLSEYVNSKKFDLSYEARALGCHAIEIYCSRLQSNDYDYLKVHCYRATIETIILRHWPKFRRTGLNSVRHTPQLSFSDYCKKALQKLQVEVPESELDSNETLSNLARWKDVVLYYSVRLMLAPLVEMLVLMDRLLYLIENGVQCKLFPAFEPEVSPRNQILLATKD